MEKKNDHSHKRSDACLNCGYVFGEPRNFCPECGQENHDLKIPFKHLFLETLEGTLHLDAKLFSTLKTLIAAPGKLTYDFNRGKRVTHVPPIRLYVFISFVFFLLLSLNSSHGSHETTGEKEPRLPAFIKISTSDAQKFEGKNLREIDSIIAKENPKAGTFGKLALRQIARMSNEGAEVYTHMLLRSISYMMFALMPLFAALVMAFNRKSYYIENLVFSVHIHCFLFLTISVLLTAALFVRAEMVFLLLYPAAAVYLHKATPAAFPGLRKSFFRTLLIAVVYLFVVLIATLGAAAFSVMLF